MMSQDMKYVLVIESDIVRSLSCNQWWYHRKIHQSLQLQMCATYIKHCKKGIQGCRLSLSCMDTKNQKS